MLSTSGVVFVSALLRIEIVLNEMVRNWKLHFTKFEHLEEITFYKNQTYFVPCGEGVSDIIPSLLNNFGTTFVSFRMGGGCE